MLDSGHFILEVVRIFRTWMDVNKKHINSLNLTISPRRRQYRSEAIETSRLLPLHCLYPLNAQVPIQDLVLLQHRAFRQFLEAISIIGFSYFTSFCTNSVDPGAMADFGLTNFNAGTLPLTTFGSTYGRNWRVEQCMFDEINAVLDDGFSHLGRHLTTVDIAMRPRIYWSHASSSTPNQPSALRAFASFVASASRLQVLRVQIIDPILDPTEYAPLYFNSNNINSNNLNSNNINSNNLNSNNINSNNINSNNINSRSMLFHFGLCVALPRLHTFVVTGFDVDISDISEILAQSPLMVRLDLLTCTSPLGLVDMVRYAMIHAPSGMVLRLLEVSEHEVSVHGVMTPFASIVPADRDQFRHSGITVQDDQGARQWRDDPGYLPLGA